MTPEAITLLLKEATEAFTVIEGKPLDDDILDIRETLLPLLMDIPFDLVGGIHSLTGLITETCFSEVIGWYYRPNIHTQDSWHSHPIIII